MGDVGILRTSTCPGMGKTLAFEVVAHLAAVPMAKFSDKKVHGGWRGHVPEKGSGSETEPKNAMAVEHAVMASDMPDGDEDQKSGDGAFSIARVRGYHRKAMGDAEAGDGGKGGGERVVEGAASAKALD